MLDPYLGIWILAVIALAVGLVIFGGTTLTYFLDKRRSDPPSHKPVRR
jgi:hypothetical protein